MNNGFIKTAAVTINVKPADVDHNVEMIIDGMREASDKGAKIIVFPELAITGVTCGDLFMTPVLLQSSLKGLARIEEASSEIDALAFVGLPLSVRGKVMNAAAAICKGRVLGFCTKTYMNPAVDGRYFKSAGSLMDDNLQETYFRNGEELPIGNKLLFRCESMNDLMVACEIGSDIMAPVGPGTLSAMAGATIIVNPASDREIPGSASLRRELISSTSRRNLCGYVYAGSGIGESTTDQVYSGHSLIAEFGEILSESVPYENGIIYNDIDVELAAFRRSKSPAYVSLSTDKFKVISFNLTVEETQLDRKFAFNPFIPSDAEAVDAYCEEVLDVQARALSERMRRIGCKHPVVGISGGLDSTLALIACARAMDILGLPRNNIEAITMPCFGTTQRTKSNADRMIEAMGANYRMINIGDSVMSHFRDIGHDESVMNAAYENAQARERTQVLMDIANDIGGIVVGTGDLSELALGWATYNGDHMSMYGVNATIPKTLVRILVAHYADNCGDKLLKKTLYDVIDTPVSPELIPGREGKIEQKTEDLVGPYEIHDFVLYHTLENGYTPDKIYRIACETLKESYDEETILHWMNNFYRRFFSQQFKRSCSPEGPQAGPVSLSPRGGLAMPSDAASVAWINTLSSPVSCIGRK